MFDDPRKELELLQEQLLKDEEWFEKELDSAKRMIGQQPAAKRAPMPTPSAAPQKTAPVRNYANGYGQAAPQTRQVPEEKLPQPKTKGVRGPLTLAVIETLCIAGLAVYWVLFLLK